MDQLKFNPTNIDTGFNPETAPDFSKAGELNRQQYSKNIARVQQLMEYNNRAMMTEAKKQGQDLIALGQFSEKALEVGTEIVGAIQEENEINDLYDFLTGGGTEETAPDAPLVEQADAQATAAATATNNVEQQTGSPVVAEQFRSTYTPPAAQQIVSERGSLLQAQVAYSPFMQTWMSGNQTITVGGQTMNIRDAVSSGDTRLINAAIAAGRREFIRQNGLAGVSRRNFVKILGNTIIQTDASLGGRLAADAIEQRREQGRKAVEAQSYAIAQASTTENLQSNWREAADYAYQSGFYQTRGAANEAVTESMLRGLAADGNVDAINALRDLTKRDGEPMTALGIQYGAMFDEYEDKAITQQNRIERETRDDIENSMYQELAALGDSATVEQRIGVVRNYIDQLRAAGQYTEARELEGKITSLTLDGSKDVNFAELQQGIATGETSIDDINRRELLGDISSTQANSLRTQASRYGIDSELSGDDKEITGDWEDRFETDFLVSAGLKKDPNGTVDLIGEDSLVSPGEAKIIIGQGQRELRAAVSLALSQNPGISGLRRTQLVNETVQNWYQANVKDPNGRYHISEGTETANYSENDRKRFQTIVENPETRTFTPIAQDQRPIDFSGFTRHNGYISDEEAKLFNPIRGDIVFSRQDVVQMAEDFRKGKVDPRLIRYGESFRFNSPAAFLNQQLGAHGLNPVSSPEIEDQADLSGVTGARRLIALGFPTRAAAYIAGTIQQESTWNGQRTWGAVYNPSTGQYDGTTINKGLLSWAAPEGDMSRINRIEQFLGKPIEQASDMEQLQAIIYEMRTFYPKSYRQLMNPYSTPRQLEEALYGYVVYGHKGSRYVYAEEIYSQLR